MLDLTQAVRFAAGDVVIRAGERDRALYLVASGTLEILLPGQEGRSDHRYGTIGPGGVTGEISFVDGRPRSATIRGLTAGELRRFTSDAFEVLAARHPELGRAILLDLARILAARLRRANRIIARLDG